MIPIFEKLYPDCVGDFYFDQSTNHAAFPPDSLNAREMNVKPGGKQRRMHSTVIPEDNPHPHLCGQVQEMIFPSTLPPTHPYYEFYGQPKGMHVILEERGLWDILCQSNGVKALVGVCADCKLSDKAHDKRAKEEAAALAGEDFDWPPQYADDDDDNVDPILWSSTCCMQRVLSLQHDFVSEKSMLQTYIESKGHNCFFLPKFYCEFNLIEMYWGWVKARMFLLNYCLLHTTITDIFHYRFSLPRRWNLHHGKNTTPSDSQRVPC